MTAPHEPKNARRSTYSNEKCLFLLSLWASSLSGEEGKTKRAVILLPIEAPNAVLDVDKTLATRRVHKHPQLVRRAVITRRKLEHRLNAVQWESAQIREHTLYELSPTKHSEHSTKYTTKSYAPSSIPSFVPPAVAVP
jgi:hypothetical protein